MNIVKNLHSSLLHKCFSYQEKHYFTVSVLWGFNLQTGEPVLEQAIWKSIGDMLGKNEIFDTGMPKPNAELLVAGSCFAPNHQAVNASRVSVSLGAISKELLVFGDRNWIKGLGVGWGLSDPKPFTEMPVSYSNAFGGNDYAPNPVGKGVDEIESDIGPVTPVPNIEYADQLIGSPKDRPQPASFNRIDMMCEQRMSNAGTYDQKYIETRMPGFPDDLDYKYFNDAAQDQWVTEYFKGDEHYEIHNMHPEHALIKGQIPGVYGRAFVNHLVNDEIEFKEISTKLDTVWFLPTEGIGVLIHRGTLEVNEDDAADIKQILIANENIKDTPRSPEHYKNELEMRTDPEEAYKYMMYTAPLIPEGVTCAFKVIEESVDFPLDMLANKNMENYNDGKKKEIEAATNQQLEDMKKQLVDSGMEQQKIDDIVKQFTDSKDKPADIDPEIKKINEIMEKVMPGMSENPGKFDLSKLNLKPMDELNAHMEQMQKDKKNEAKVKLGEQLDEMKKITKGPEAALAAAQLESTIKELDLPPILPRIDIDGIINELKNQQNELEKQLLQMRSMGVPEEDLKKITTSVNISEIEEQTRESLGKANEGYLIGAHYIEKARSPHHGQEDTIREKLLAAYKSGGQTSHGDYAFVDLSNLDLTGIDFSGAFLEYANLTNTNLTNANLSKAILSHAKFHKTILVKTDLTEANLGAINFDSAIFDDADLTGATLGKSMLSNTQFINCKMAEKMDMFLDTKFDNASFIDSDMRKSIFVDADISGCVFSGTDLTESNFVNPVMKKVVFSGANLTGVNIVTAVVDGSKFDKAVMKNVRFVGGCSLNDTDFLQAKVNEANLRECSLQNARFDEADLCKSDFGDSDLRNASFKKAHAVEAQFSKANLEFASFSKANLMEGSMYKARLSSTEFRNANVYGVNFLGCTIGDTDFTGADVNQTIFKDWKP